MERLTKRDTDGQAMMDCQKCKADWMGKHGKPMDSCTALYCRNRLKDRIAAYEDTGLTPERCAEFARADAEGRYSVMRSRRALPACASWPRPTRTGGWWCRRARREIRCMRLQVEKP